MATYTPNYNLSKPEATDDFDAFRASYGDNMDILDNNLGGGGGGGGGGHTIVDPDGTDMPQENKLQFTGAVNVSDDSVNGQTVVDIEGGGNYYLNTIYSEEEKKVGYWTDGKPLYQKTVALNNLSVTNNRWARTNESATGIETIAGGFLIDNQSPSQTFQCDIGVDGGYIAVLTWFVGNSARTMSYLTFRYTKSTDNPELNPQTGGVIYLPTIYSEEEREVGVWRDGKPLYQRTWVFSSGLTVSYNSWTNTSIDSTDIENIVSVNATHNDGTCYEGIMADPTRSSHTLVGLQTSRNNNDASVKILTLQYTKISDTAGSGSWTPSGANAVHYSTNEQVIGTWIDGKPRYEITLSGSGSYSAGAELVVPLPTNADKVVIMGGYVDIGTDWLPLALTLGVGTGTTNGVYCYPNKSTGIHIYSSAWTFSEYNVTVQYCKTTD